MYDFEDGSISLSTKVIMQFLYFPGVYTKNRNFRLFMSSKLNKNNPLILSHRNQFKTVNGANSEENIFYESLVSNVQ